MRWRERLLFEAGGSGRPPVLVDGDGAVATSPVEMLLVAAATCAASDVVLILEKQRVALGALEVALRGTRREEQPRRYTALHLVFTISGGGVGVAGRSGGQGRFAFTAACGDYERALGVGLEATAQFLLRPAERSGIGPYGGLGLAFVGSDGARGASYLTALLGVDTGPGARAGWYAELGLGGGGRLALGRRFRRMPCCWPRQSTGHPWR